MLRLASSPARASTATWSIAPMRGSRCFNGSSNPVGSAGACAIPFECRVPLVAGAKRALAVTLVAVLVLFAAACGGKKGGNSTSASGTTTEATTTVAAAPLAKAAYVARMKVIGQSLSTSLNTLGSATTAKKAATALAQVQKDLNTAADKLAAIAPPASVKTQHDSLTKAVRDFADELSPVITKLQAGNMSALSTVPTLK